MLAREHEISSGLGTPERNHIIFPDPHGKQKKHVSELQASKEKAMSKKIVSENFPAESIQVKIPKLKIRSVKDFDSSRTFEERCSSQGFDHTSKQKINNNATENFLRDSVKSVPVKVCESVAVKGAQLSSRNNSIKPKQQNIPHKVEKIKSLAHIMKTESSSQPLADAELETRLCNCFKLSFTYCCTLKHHKTPTPHPTFCWLLV